MLETLADESYYANPHSCNARYWVSSVDSDYEWYGGTSGGYFADFSYAGRCEELRRACVAALMPTTSVPKARRWWAVDGPGFWLAGVVFAGNGLFSVWQHDWRLAILQFGTAMLAVRTAFLAGAAHEVHGGYASEMDRGAEPTQGGLIEDSGVPPDRW